MPRAVLLFASIRCTSPGLSVECGWLLWHERDQDWWFYKVTCWRADRQRTLRELVLGRTLVKEDGKWLIRHGASDYKTGRSYGERPPLVIAESIYPYVRAGALKLLMTWQ